MLAIIVDETLWKVCQKIWTGFLLYIGDTGKYFSFCLWLKLTVEANLCLRMTLLSINLAPLVLITPLPGVPARTSQSTKLAADFVKARNFLLGYCGALLRKFASVKSFLRAFGFRQLHMMTIQFYIFSQCVIHCAIYCCERMLWMFIWYLYYLCVYII